MPMVTNTMKLAEVATPHGVVTFDPQTYAGDATAEQAEHLRGLPGYLVADAPAKPAPAPAPAADDKPTGKKKKAEE